MANLLLELFCEEIPARMQMKAAEDLSRLLGNALVEAGIPPSKLDCYATPRRLAVIGHDVPDGAPDMTEERRGPRPDAPEKAIAGFLNATGLTRDALIEKDEGKGAFLYARIEKKGQPTPAHLADIIPAIVRSFPWPKSMRWGPASIDSASLRWVRPLQSIICLHNGKVVPFSIDGIDSDKVTRGHRHHGNAPFPVANADAYRDKLKVNKVILASDDRMKKIEVEAEKLAQANGFELIPDSGLLAENAGLTEWPVPLLGRFDAAFLDVPSEVIQLTMRTNQKYFALRNAETGKFANAFICVANLDAQDGGKAIIAGNEKVLAARLADAKFFWEQDQKTRLDDQLGKLEKITFHEKLGTLAQRVNSIEALTEQLAPFNKGIDVAQARRAARLAKADLVTEMVGEFPELQGIMGGYYARLQGESFEVAQAIAEHYAPQGPSDAVPVSPESIAVALAEKLDTLVGFFAIDEKPTGSKDPYALRRAALGVIRLIVENGLRVPLAPLFEKAPDLLDFFADRLKVQQREAGVRHDLIDAVFALGGEDDLVRLLARVHALQAFIGTEDGANLLAGYKRAANILRIEEKKDGRPYDGPIDFKALPEPAEQALADLLEEVEPDARKAIAAEDFTAAMAALSRLRAPVDAFFDSVTVNADDAALRANRLNLLNRIRTAVHAVADFSRIEG